MSRKFLSQWHMAEAKIEEAIANSIQKRDKTNFPLSRIIAWSCDCCIGPVIMYHKKPILTPEEADEVLRLRKRRRK